MLYKLNDSFFIDSKGVEFYSITYKEIIFYEGLNMKNRDLVDNVKNTFGNLCESAVFEQNQFSNIKISVLTENVTITPYNENIVKVTVHSNLPEDECPKIKLEDDTLFILSGKRKFHFRMFWDFFGEVEIFVPKSFVQKKNGFVEVKTVSGSVNVESVGGEKIELCSTSGSVNASVISANTIALETKSGSVSLDDSKSTEVSLESLSSSVKCNNISSTKIKLTSASGAVKCNYSSAEQVELYGISGSVYFDGRCKTINAKTVSGSCKIQNGIAFTGDVCLKSTSGSVYLSMPENDGYTLEYSTVSGSVHDSFIGANTKGKGSYKYKSGSFAINAASVSGSIFIEKY